MVDKAKHAFGSEARVDAALANGTLDAYDVLFLDEKKIGWIDKNGNKVIAEGNKQVKKVSVLPSSGMEQDMIYLYNNKGYIWNGTQFVCIFTDVDALELAISSKADIETVDEKINKAIKIVEF